ncbi:MAG: VWA domain-containing protein [Oscillospiraceae bacterium]|nr:VWA domain-containing protein [Oscillospiraceae bacterium]
MTDPEVYLEKLSDFSRMLRLKGMAVSPRETEDAAKLLTIMGMAEREQVKTALRTIYAKSREEQLNFDVVFDGFFLSEETMRARAKEHAKRDWEQEQARRKAEEELEQYGDKVQLTEAERESYVVMSEDVRKKLRNIVERFRGNMARNPDLYRGFIRSVFAKTIMEQQLMMEDAGTGCEASDPELGILYRNIGEFRDTEIPQAIAMIQKVARQINGELSAKRKRSGNTGKLDFRRTIRKGMETGGSFYRLSYRKKRSRRRHLVMLCDVSGSMVQFSEFALRFIQSLNQVAESSRTFLFSERMVEADAFRLQNMDLFRNYVRESGIYGMGTDVGSALEQLCGEHPSVLNAGTTLLIFSDAKTINPLRAIAAVKEARRMAGRVIWLNPIPEGKWKYLKSSRTMAEVVTMISCSTLQELAAACRKLTMN